MNERRFSGRTFIVCEPSEAFEWVSDFRHASEALEGVYRWRPLGARTRGKGARFEVGMRALGFPLENQLVLDTWEPSHAIAWHSVSGLIRQAGGWSLRRRPGGTEVTLTISYQPPAGAVGLAVAGRVEGLVRRRLEKALARMKRALETAEAA